MKISEPNVLIVLDDRELTSGDVRSIVGLRRYGDIIYKRQFLADHFQAALPGWAKKNFIRIQNFQDLEIFRTRLEDCGSDTMVCIIAGRAAFETIEQVTLLVERLPYAEESFTNTLYKPLLVFLRDAHSLVSKWTRFENEPLHFWEQPWQDCHRLKSVNLFDISRIGDFLSFIAGSTATRHFNSVQIDDFYYKKISADKEKMHGEYAFYNLVPEKMRPWLVETFNFQDVGTHASYQMLRYYLADAALQWVHDAFDPVGFKAFVRRLLFFVADRPRRHCEKTISKDLARELFVSKLEKRVSLFLGMPEGRAVNSLLTSASVELDISRLLGRYLKLYSKLENDFSLEYSVIGHGDPCFSNILYDQQRYLMKLIDPKGAIVEEQLWTHPIYDLCKISHSVLGDYDFINNGLFSVALNQKNNLTLGFNFGGHQVLKDIFREALIEAGFDLKVIRLGEASLFLSMLPLHVDHPNKVLAFALKASHIIAGVEND